MAEIEHFVDPLDKSHPKFCKVTDYKMKFFSACNQMDGKPAEVLTIGAAVSSVSCSYIIAIKTCRIQLVFVRFMFQ